MSLTSRRGFLKTAGAVAAAACAGVDRLSARTPMKGMYLCGAATHPGGSVICINGRNAAMAVLKDINKN